MKQMKTPAIHVSAKQELKESGSLLRYKAFSLIFNNVVRIRSTT